MKHNGHCLQVSDASFFDSNERINRKVRKTRRETIRYRRLGISAKSAVKEIYARSFPQSNFKWIHLIFAIDTNVKRTPRIINNRYSIAEKWRKVAVGLLKNHRRSENHRGFCAFIESFTAQDGLFQQPRYPHSSYPHLSQSRLYHVCPTLTP